VRTSWARGSTGLRIRLSPTDPSGCAQKRFRLDMRLKKL
jgi:hypothetical protein